MSPCARRWAFRYAFMAAGWSRTPSKERIGGASAQVSAGRISGPWLRVNQTTSAVATSATMTPVTTALRPTRARTEWAPMKAPTLRASHRKRDEPRPDATESQLAGGGSSERTRLGLERPGGTPIAELVGGS